MIEFKTVPLSLNLRGRSYPRGTILKFDGIYKDGKLYYRLWPEHCRHAVHYGYCFEWFTHKQIQAMQPHWITQQEELAL